jgi:hypothetical protein
MRYLLGTSALVATLATSSVALAGGRYVGLGLGGAASVNEEFSGNGSEDGVGMSGRLFGGQTWSLGPGSLGFEVALGKFGIGRNEEQLDYAGTSLAAGAKGALPVYQKLEATLRAGIEKTWLSGQNDRHVDVEGSGWYAGLGVQYPLTLGPVSGAVFADVTRHEADTTRGRQGSHLTADMWSLGVIVGF